jgi:hypothetical protein
MSKRFYLGFVSVCQVYDADLKCVSIISRNILQYQNMKYSSWDIKLKYTLYALTLQLSLAFLFHHRQWCCSCLDILNLSGRVKQLLGQDFLPRRVFLAT